MTPLRAVPCPHSPPVHGKLHSKQRSIAPQAAQGQAASLLLWDSRLRSVGPFSNSRSGSHSGAAHHHGSPRNCGSTRPGFPTDEHQHQQGSFSGWPGLQSSVPLRGSFGGIPVPGHTRFFFSFPVLHKRQRALGRVPRSRIVPQQRADRVDASQHSPAANPTQAAVKGLKYPGCAPRKRQRPRRHTTRATITPPQPWALRREGGPPKSPRANPRTQIPQRRDP